VVCNGFVSKNFGAHPRTIPSRRSYWEAPFPKRDASLCLVEVLSEHWAPSAPGLEIYFQTWIFSTIQGKRALANTVVTR
jgi:hypothetical protein